MFECMLIVDKDLAALLDPDVMGEKGNRYDGSHGANVLLLQQNWSLRWATWAPGLIGLRYHATSKHERPGYPAPVPRRAPINNPCEISRKACPFGGQQCAFQFRRVTVSRRLAEL